MDLRYQLLRRRADRLLAPWRRANGPGATIGVVLGGELVVHQSAGMASIELALPIGDETTFRIASVSKLFTCAAVILLAAESKLSVNDAVRDHLALALDLTAVEPARADGFTVRPEVLDRSGPLFRPDSSD